MFAIIMCLGAFFQPTMVGETIYEFILNTSSDSQKQALKPIIQKLTMEDMVGGDILTIFNTNTNRRISVFKMPDGIRPNVPEKLRLEVISAKSVGIPGIIATFKRELSESVNEEFDLFHYMRQLKYALASYPNYKVVVMYLGNPLVRNENASLDLHKGYLSLGALSFSGSPYSVRGFENALDGKVSIHIMYPSKDIWNPLAPDKHQEEITKFYAVFCQELGAKLLTFSDVMIPSLSGDFLPITYEYEKIKGEDAVSIQFQDSLKSEEDSVPGFPIWAGEVAHQPNPAPLDFSTPQEGFVTLGLKWFNTAHDLDLFVVVEDEEISFRTRGRSDSKFKGDFVKVPSASAQQRGYETCTFTQVPVDLSKVRMFVHFYDSTDDQITLPVDFELRVDFKGNIWRKQFSIRKPPSRKYIPVDDRIAAPDWIEISPLEVIGDSSNLEVAKNILKKKAMSR